MGLPIRHRSEDRIPHPRRQFANRRTRIGYRGRPSQDRRTEPQATRHNCPVYRLAVVDVVGNPSYRETTVQSSCDSPGVRFARRSIRLSSRYRASLLRLAPLFAPSRSHGRSVRPAFRAGQTALDPDTGRTRAPRMRRVLSSSDQVRFRRLDQTRATPANTPVTNPPPEARGWAHAAYLSRQSMRHPHSRSGAAGPCGARVSRRFAWPQRNPP